MDTKRKIGVGVRVLGAPTWLLLDSLLQLETPDGEPWQLIRNPRPMPFDLAAEHVAGRALVLGCSHLLFVDQDAMLHPKTLTRLLSWDQPVVAALAFTRSRGNSFCTRASHRMAAKEEARTRDETIEWIAAHPALWRNSGFVLDPRPADALIEVKWLGLHCTLVRCDVFEALSRPWFRGDQVSRVSEDSYFCENAREAGFPLYLDRSVLAGHVLSERTSGVMDFLGTVLLESMLPDLATRAFELIGQDNTAWNVKSEYLVRPGHVVIDENETQED